MNVFRKMRKDAKALSPIFAVLILIAIAVIAGIVVYMFSSGFIGTMTASGPAAQEKAAVQGVSFSLNEVYANYVAGPNVITITGAIVRDASGNVVLASDAATFVTVDLPMDGTLETVSVAGLSVLASGTYTVTLTSSKGGSFVSSSFIVP